MNEKDVLAINEEFSKNGQKVNILLASAPTKLAITNLRDTKSSIDYLKQAAAIVAQQLFSQVIQKENLLTTGNVQTPMALMTNAPVLKAENIVIVPILRGGLPYALGITSLTNKYACGYLLMENNRKAKTVSLDDLILSSFYIPKNIDEQTAHIILVEGAIASGSTIRKAVAALKEEGFKKITVLAAFATKQVMHNLAEELPNVNFFVAVLDPILDATNYIVPGTGDLTDRIYGDKKNPSNGTFEKDLQKFMETGISNNWFAVDEINNLALYSTITDISKIPICSMQ